MMSMLTTNKGCWRAAGGAGEDTHDDDAVPPICAIVTYETLKDLLSS
jgi:hypothetical protein